MPKKILITGISGFVGKYLSDYLSGNKNLQIFGTDIHQNPQKNIFQCDIANSKETEKVIKDIQPDQVFHLAAISSNAETDKEKIFKVNVSGSLNLLSACAKLNKNVSALLASTAYVYGNTKRPAKEQDPINPTGIYAESKAEMEKQALKLNNPNLKIIITRAFNHTGPGQTENFVIPAFAKQIAEIEKNKIKNNLYVGNLEAKRDFLDVKDVIKAYGSIIEKGMNNEIYNIASGNNYSIKEILNKLLTLSKIKIKIVKDLQRNRKSDISVLIGNYGKINRLCGWKPKISLDQTLKDTLNYWRNKIK